MGKDKEMEILNKKYDSLSLADKYYLDKLYDEKKSEISIDYIKPTIYLSGYCLIFITLVSIALDYPLLIYLGLKFVLTTVIIFAVLLLILFIPLIRIIKKRNKNLLKKLLK